MNVNPAAARLAAFALALLLAAGAAVPAAGQTIDSTLFRHLHWRMIGPHRGGRTVGVAGIPEKPCVFYAGVNNGGVWKTDDCGRTWKPLFDGQPTGSIGAIALAPSNPDIIYAGSGEGLQRPDLSVGDGMFKSTDAGRTWLWTGLGDAQQISAVAVDPRDAGRVFAAVLGHPYGANEERGVFRSANGGASWSKVLYVDENTGAVSVVIDPSNPGVVFAVLWSSRQGPWENGAWQGKTSGLYKSRDGGTTWKRIGKGLPSGEEGLGRIGVAIAPGDSKRMYALVDAPSLGGVYRSDDAGESWARTNSEARVWGRGSDFAELKVHPKDKNTLFVGNTAAYRSTDAGRTFECFKGAPGGDDYHTIWINPLHPEIMLFAADQGAVVTVNGGATWSSWYNQPTAQLYHVITDDEFPYNVYGGQQESGSVGIASRGNDGQITFREWHPVSSDEYGTVAPDPLHPGIIYGGRVTRYDRSTGQVQNVSPEAVRSGRYRNLRTAPLLFSPADPRALYYGTNVLFRTTTGGAAWDTVSPDLSREAPEVPAGIGVFRTPELATQPRRGVIYSVSLSALDAGIIWAGTDDGAIHVTVDGGARWKNVTPPAMGAWHKVASIEAGHFDAQTAYAAVNCIRLDDMRPHIYRTHDGGATWSEIAAGLPANGPVNVVREDPVRKGLLFAGTERAVYVSFDDGGRWHSLRGNMPATSVRDLVIHRADIVAATHGRSFWILDDISSLRQLDQSLLRSPSILFSPAEAVRVRWNMNSDTPLPPDEPAGENPPDGAVIDFYLARDAGRVGLAFFDESGSLVRKFSSADTIAPIDEKELRYPASWVRPPQVLERAAGVHRFVWDLHHPPPEGLPRSLPIAAVVRNTAPQPQGPFVLPGEYTVELAVDGRTLRQSMRVSMDPRVRAGEGVLKEQHDLSMICSKGLDRVQGVIRELHALRGRVQALIPSVKDPAMRDTLKELDVRLSVFEGTGPPRDIDIVYFTTQDGTTVKETLNGLQTKLLYVMMLLQSSDSAPTSAQRADARRQGEMTGALVDRWNSIWESALRDIGRRLKEQGFGGLGK